MNARRTDNKWLGVTGELGVLALYLIQNIAVTSSEREGVRESSDVSTFSDRSTQAHLSSNRLRSIRLRKVWVLRSNIDIIPTGTYAGILEGHELGTFFPLSLRCNSLLVYI